MKLMAWYHRLLINPRVFTCLSLINTKERIKLYITLLVIAPGISFCMYLVKPRRGCGKQKSAKSERRHYCWLRAEILCTDKSKAPSICELCSIVCSPNPFGSKRARARECAVGLTRARPHPLYAVTDRIFMSIIYWAAYGLQSHIPSNLQVLN
jgi:hypothetical protein